MVGERETDARGGAGDYRGFKRRSGVGLLRHWL